MVVDVLLFEGKHRKMKRNPARTREEIEEVERWTGKGETSNIQLLER